MEAIIKTNDNNLFETLLPFLKSLHIKVETKEKIAIRQKQKQKPALFSEKQFDPREYEGILSHLNLDVEAELQNMRNAWGKRNF